MDRNKSIDILGDHMGMCFELGYIVKDSEYKEIDGKLVRVIKKMDLKEISIVKKDDILTQNKQNDSI